MNEVPSPLVRARPVRRRTVRVVFSVIALFLAPFSWWWSIDDPVMRATGTTVWMMLASALFLSLSAAWQDRRPWVRGVAVFQLGVLAFSLWAFFVYARLPEGRPPERALDFTLPDQDDRPVTLSAELEKGPVLLVFYRGHW